MLKSRIFLEGLSKDKITEVAEALAFKYPTWFFELYAEFDGKPLVLEDYQIRYLLDDNTFRITSKCRQAGGSLMLALNAFYKAYRTPNYRADIVSINLKEAVDKIRYIRKIHDTLPRRFRIPLTTDNQTSIGFHKGAKQSVIQSIAASSGVRGGRKDMIFDEFAHIEKAKELFYAAAPAIINGGHTLDIVSTPAGDQDLFSEIWFNKPDPRTGEHAYGDFSRHQFIWCDVRRFVTDYDAVQHVWYNELHQNMDYMEQLVRDYGTDKLKFYYHLYPWNMFLQEFCGSFIDETNALFPQSMIQHALRGTVSQADDLEEEAIETWTRRPENNDDEIFIGVDFGESTEDSDKTSVQVVVRQKGIYKQVFKENFSQKDYPDFPRQANRILQFCRAFRPNKIMMDGSGVGRGIVPMIQERAPELNIDAITFDYINKEEMVMNVKKLMEEGNLWIQAEDLALQAQFRGMERKITESGRVTYHGKPHDDMFWALCLAVKGGAYKHFGISILGGSASYRRPF